MFFLQPYKGNSGVLESPKASLRLDGDHVIIEFYVGGYRERYVNESMDHLYKNWGLWECDVFEAFLSFADSSLPYLELQVSPINQKFALLIEEPRKTSAYPDSCPFETKSEIKDGVWRSEMKIQLSCIPGYCPGRESSLMGNLHGIIGKNRDHFSFIMPKDGGESAPDFHQPKLFKKLLEPK